MFRQIKITRPLVGTALCLVVVLVACGKKESFSIRPLSHLDKATTPGETTSQSFPMGAPQKIVSKSRVDVLWVIDNSESMDPSQNKLRQALSDFSHAILKPENDIRTAVITTDTYLANPDFAHSLDRNYGSLKIRDIYPRGDSWATLYAKDGSPQHDGPQPAECDLDVAPVLGNFYYGLPQCWIRNKSPYRDPKTAREHCLRPTGDESSITQCVNTLANNSIHSGRPIISTVPPKGVAPDSAFIQQMTDDFMINASVSTSGSGYERGLGSFLQFMNDNELDPNSEAPLFRPGSQRVIVFLSDEDDQTVDDEKVMAARGVSKDEYLPAMAYTNPCKVQSEGGYTLSFCVKPEDLRPVGTVPGNPDPGIKAEIDHDFSKIDQGGAAGNYLVVSIVSKEQATIKRLQDAQKFAHHDPRLTDENGKRLPPEEVTKSDTIDQDLGRRYMQLADLVGNGSFSMDIGAEDYKPILDKLRLNMETEAVRHMSEFTLGRAPVNPSEVTVRINQGNGQSYTNLSPSQYTIDGATLRITDQALLNSLQADQHLEITYQADPKHRNQFYLERSVAGPTQVRVTIIRASGAQGVLNPSQYTTSNVPGTGAVVTITDAGVVAGLGDGDQVFVEYSPGADR